MQALRRLFSQSRNPDSYIPLRRIGVDRHDVDLLHALSDLDPLLGEDHGRTLVYHVELSSVNTSSPRPRPLVADVNYNFEIRYIQTLHCVIVAPRSNLFFYSDRDDTADRYSVIITQADVPLITRRLGSIDYFDFYVPAVNPDYPHLIVINNASTVPARVSFVCADVTQNYTVPPPDATSDGHLTPETTSHSSTPGSSPAHSSLDHAWEE